MGHEGHGKSIAKAISWRTVGSIDTFLVALVFTGHVGAAGSIAVFEVATKTVLYYLHERAWVSLPKMLAERWGAKA